MKACNLDKHAATIDEKGGVSFGGDLLTIY